MDSSSHTQVLRSTGTMTLVKRAKAMARAAIAAPGVRHGLRWFIHQQAVPAPWRAFAHRRVAKWAVFAPDRSFQYASPEGIPLRFLHSGTSNYLYWLSEYEPETTTLFGRLARSARTILDIGAADGVYTLLAAAANPEARILAFEPGSAAAHTCRTNIALNAPRTGRVELHELALGDEDDEVTLYIAGVTGGNSSLNPEFRSNRAEETITVRRGDRLLAELRVEHVDLIKVDTESTEPAVLRGLRGILERDRPDVICEVLRGRTETELEEILRPLGYTFFQVEADRLVRRASIQADATYRRPNYLFTRRTEGELAERGLVIV